MAEQEMSDEEVKAARILHEVWDPISCGVPEDEYDDYAPVVVKLVRLGVQAEALSMVLYDIATNYICVPGTSELDVTCMRTAQTLLKELHRTISCKGNGPESVL